MAKPAKKKIVTVSNSRMRLATLEARFADLYKAATDATQVRADRLSDIEKRTKAVEEAICPRVAARLTALERKGEYLDHKINANISELHKKILVLEKILENPFKGDALLNSILRDIEDRLRDVQTRGVAEKSAATEISDRTWRVAKKLAEQNNADWNYVNKAAYYTQARQVIAIVESAK